ncbi:GNAT family N-acetyltransferase [Butyrivibrio sp. MC2013]|uniref:GNAT family N-acetyltransferase n=1 Tax=Butyrivibrio sp. MC2013 TaxID=1280686 RepID=UPI000688D2DB|nr:GNAT family N-acetyltransferase [Butyrivibrio sp. MC2013]
MTDRIKISNDGFGLRPAVMEDARLLYDWRNDEDTRRFSFNKEPIRYEDHLKWLEKKLGQDDCLILIFSDNEGDAGQVRYDICDGIALMSYSIDKDRRGRGYAGIMLEMAATLLRRKYGDVTVKAEVLPGNAASVRVFQKLGYLMEREDDHYVFYNKKTGDK